MINLPGPCFCGHLRRIIRAGFRPFSSCQVPVGGTNSALPRPTNKIVSNYSSLFQDGLDLLRGGNILNGDRYRWLWYLPHWAYLTDRQSDLMDVLDKWWLQIRPQLMANDEKVPSLLIHLGKLQENFPNVSIVSKIGGTVSLDIILRRCVEIGLDRYLFTDINSALSGLMFLINTPSQEHRIDVNRLNYYPLWLSRYNDYVLSRSSSDRDWTNIVEYDANVAMGLFRQFDLKQPTDVIRTLCQFALIGFDRTDLPIPEETVWLSLTNYAGCLLYFGINADALVPGSWRSWYRITGHLLDTWNRDPNATEPPPLNFINYLLSVALQFDQPIPFADIYDSWRYALLSLLDNPSYLPSQLAHCHLSNMAYNLGSMACRHGECLERKMDSIVDLMERVQDTFVEVAPVYEQTAVMRILSGLRYLRLRLEMVKGVQLSESQVDRTSPSIALLHFLDRHCLPDVSLTTAVQCTYAAETLFVLYQLRCVPSRALLNRLVSIVSRSLHCVRDTRLEKVLCYSGHACAWYSAYGGHLVEYDLHQQFWTSWFNVVGVFLRNPTYSSVQERNTRLPYLLFVIVYAADKASAKNFARIQSVWEELVIQEMNENRLPDKTKTSILLVVRRLITLRNCVFSAAVMKQVDRVVHQ